MSRRARMFAISAMVSVAACRAAAPLPATAPQPVSGLEQPVEASQPALTPLTIDTRGGARHYRVEIARTVEEQARGLMYRTALPADGGMLFPFPSVRTATFWMKNTPLPLDIIFIRADGTIARIAERTTPYSLDLIDSGEPVAAVLELTGGEAAAKGMAEGDRVRWQDEAR